MIGEVTVVVEAAAEAVATAASTTTNVAGYFGSAAREARSAGLPTPATTSFVPDQHGAAEVVEVEVEFAEVVDDQPTVADSSSCHKMPAKNPVAIINTSQSHR